MYSQLGEHQAVMLTLPGIHSCRYKQSKPCQQCCSTLLDLHSKRAQLVRPGRHGEIAVQPPGLNCSLSCCEIAFLQSTKQLLPEAAQQMNHANISITGLILLIYIYRYSIGSPIGQRCGGVALIVLPHNSHQGISHGAIRPARLEGVLSICRGFLVGTTADEHSHLLVQLAQLVWL